MNREPHTIITNESTISTTATTTTIATTDFDKTTQNKKHPNILEPIGSPKWSWNSTQQMSSGVAMVLRKGAEDNKINFNTSERRSQLTTCDESLQEDPPYLKKVFNPTLESFSFFQSLIIGEDEGSEETGSDSIDEYNKSNI